MSRLASCRVRRRRCRCRCWCGRAGLCSPIRGPPADGSPASRPSLAVGGSRVLSRSLMAISSVVVAAWIGDARPGRPARARALRVMQGAGARLEPLWAACRCFERRADRFLDPAAGFGARLRNFAELVINSCRPRSGRCIAGRCHGHASRAGAVVAAGGGTPSAGCELPPHRRSALARCRCSEFDRGARRLPTPMGQARVQAALPRAKHARD